MSSLLTITDLSVGPAASPNDTIVRGVSLELERGDILGIVGETGAGKTLTMRGILGALPDGLASTIGAATFDGRPVDLDATMKKLRGDRIGIVVQDPVAALPPVRTVGRSLTTLLRTHRPITRRQARAKIESMFREVGLPDPAAVFAMRPHELSGGMAQRVVIAAAFMTDPDLIVADEPTTALDPTVQLQILKLLMHEVRSREAGAIIITHDIGVVAQVCSHIMVMYGGEVREAGTVDQVLRNPTDSYTRELLASLPSLDDLGAEADDADPGPPIVEARNIVKTFRGRKTPVLSDVSLSVLPGRTTAIVGESGAGKTTLVRTLLKLEDIDSGAIVLDGVDVTPLSTRQFRPLRRDIQVVYQNPNAALNPRLTIRRLLEEPLVTFPEPGDDQASRDARVTELLRSVRLDPVLLDRFPAALSGGQKQRVAIARALAIRPKVVVLDEPTASLDISVRKHVLELLADLQKKLGVAYVLISHDFHTVRHLAHEVVVLYRGEVVESGPTAEVLRRPTQEYTKVLIAAELSTEPAEERVP